MAILRGQDGKFYDLDDAVLEGKEVKPENLPEENGPGSPETSGGGAGGHASGIVQIFVNAGGGAATGSPAAPAREDESEGGDVEGHSRCGWHNHWRNWRNWRNCGWRNNCPSNFEPR